MTVAVTGSFASGKSTFVEMLGALGAETASADEIVHGLLSEDEETIVRVAERFGENVLGEGGVDRRSLGRKVFGDAEALQDLEDILHPLVRRETDRRIETSEERRRAWAAQRGVDEAALRAIEQRQFSQQEKARRADVVVQNDGDLDKLREQAEELQEKISRERSLGGRVRRQEA